MGIIYLLSVLFLCITFILIKKTEKVLDIISFTGITIVLMLCYNALVCYILTFVSIPITLLSLGIINVIFSLIMLAIILKNKEIQKYKLDKFSLLSIGIILVAVLIVSYINFGFPFEIKYETGDPADHNFTSMVFATQDRLINLNNDDVYGVLQGRKIGSYVNSGIIMKCFSGVIDEIDYYNIFIAFGIFILFMTGSMMYSTLEKFTKTKNSKILALIVSIIYVMGYPLNSFLFGFEYLSLGILVVGTIIHMIYYFENEELKFPYILIIFALLNFDVFCSYYMFVPFTYSALWIYFCIYSKKKDKKIICKKNITILLVTLIVPFLLGYIYHLAPGIYNIFQMDAYTALKTSLEHSSNILNNSFALYGYIYVNFYSNTILLIPLIIYYIYKKIKEKEFLSFETIFLIFLLVFIGILFIGVGLGKVSTYFLMKNYYILWLALIYINFKGLMYINEKNKAKSYAIVMFYTLLIILNLIFIKAPLSGGAINKNENITNVVEIFGVNKTILIDRENDYNLKEIEILKYAKENLNFSDDKIEILANPEQVFWTYSLLRYVNHDEYVDNPSYSGQTTLTLKAVTAYEKIGKVDYMIYFNRSYYYKKAENDVFENGEVIYENEAGGIIKYNK